MQIDGLRVDRRAAVTTVTKVLEDKGRGVGVRPGVATPLPRVTGVIAEGGVADSGRAAPLPCKKRLWLRAAGDFFAK